MKQTNMHSLSVEEIMQKIRDEVKQRNPSSYQQASAQSTLSLALFHQEPFEIKAQYEVQDFIKYVDTDFIANIYKGVLKRSPDPEGMEFYLHALRNGERTKTEILSTFRFSSEGRKQNVKILGIKKRFLVTAIYRIPIVSYLAKYLTTLSTLPLLLRQQNQNTATIQRLQKENIDLFLQLEKAVNSKTDRTELDSKTDKTELEIKTVKTELNKKADKTELNKKNDKNELEVKTVKTELNKKADKIALDLKADRTELDNKADTSELALYLQTVNYAKDYLSLVQEKLNNLINEAKQRLPDEFNESKLNENEINAIIEEENHALDAMYIAFEDKFRGTRAEIKSRLAMYLPYIYDVLKTTEDAPVLDIGCGRGEWLELLKENNILARGVDLNRLMVKLCKDNNLDVIEADAIEFLKSQADNSLAVITGFHIIEHLPFKILLSLYEQALRALKPGGLIIFETPNPENLTVGACNFYTDPTHINPIPPRTAKFLIKDKGFMDVEIIYTQKLNTIKTENAYLHEFLNTWVNKSPDYAIIGYKA